MGSRNPSNRALQPRREALPVPTSSRTVRRLATLALAATMLAGCGSASTTRLPDIKAAPRPLLSADEQKAAIADLERRKAELEKAAAASRKAGP